jgi:hypothetical protein
MDTTNASMKPVFRLVDELDALKNWIKIWKQFKLLKYGWNKGLLFETFLKDNDRIRVQV